MTATRLLVSTATLLLCALAGCATDTQVDPEGFKCDPGDVCPVGFSCVSGVCTKEVVTPGSCANVTCAQAPASVCKDANVLLVYSAPGECSPNTGSCQFPSTQVPCAGGCADGQCVGDVCAGRTCAAPPRASCLDATTLRAWAALGTCDPTLGGCSYVYTDTTCAQGCSGGQCVGDPCASVVCSSPPQSTCLDAQTLRTFSSAGTCDNATGVCSYASTDTACANGCEASQCKGDPCAGVTCDAPPPNGCVAANTLRAWSGTGTCDAKTGSCSYESSELKCQFGCVNAACNPDPCAGKVCDAPGAPTCLDKTTLRTFAQTGTCDSNNGACSYAPTDTACKFGCEGGACKNQDLCAGVVCAPPVPVCSGASVKTFAGGTCEPSTGQCAYQETLTPCDHGCGLGACLAPSKTFTQVGPRIRQRISAIDIAPGSSGAHVLAVGPKGFAVKWNGTEWKPLPTGTTQDLRAVWLRNNTTGYVVGNGGTLLRYNGTSFSPVTLNKTPSGSFISVHGAGARVAALTHTGEVYRSFDGTTFNLAPSFSLDITDPKQIYVGSDGSESVGARCADGFGSFLPCVVYSNSGPCRDWCPDVLDWAGLSTSFTAVGPSIDSGYSFAGIGKEVYRHYPGTGSFDTTRTPSTLSGGYVHTIALDEGSSTPAVFILMHGDGTGLGRMFRYTSGNSLTPLLGLFGYEQTMSRNDSGGVVIADISGTVASVYRRGVTTDETLDFSEDLEDVSVSPQGHRVFGTAWADLVMLEAGKTAYRVGRSPLSSASFNGVVASSTFAVVYGNDGKAFRSSPASGYVRLQNTGTNHFYSGCRNTDTELYLVGAGGKIVLYDGTTVTTMSSPTSQTLREVVCTGAGEAFAVGAGGTVLRLSGGVWSPLPNRAPTNLTLRTAWASPDGGLYVAGDNVFLVYRGGTWNTLATKPLLQNLIGRSKTEIYATSGKEILRYDGAGWNKVYTAPATLLGGAADGSRLLFVGADGLIVESSG